MIELPRLDDQKYTEIVEAAKRRIPVIFPEWTDFNEHDPGITIIELFAWLKEMQQYTLDRIPDSTREAMLLLAGAEPRRPAPAKTRLGFSGDVPGRLPAGSSAVSADGTEFTLTEPFVSQEFSVRSVFMRSAEGFVDVTGISAEPGTAFYPFGAELDCAGRSLFIQTDAPVQELTLDIIADDRCEVARNPYDSEDGAPRRIVWEYSTAGGFRECTVLRDETHGLSFSGRLTLHTGDDMAACQAEVPAAGIWLRARVEYGGCEDMPLLSGIFTNTVELTQKHRESAFRDVFLEDGRAEVEDVLAVSGQRMVMLRDEHGWLDIPDPEEEITGSRVRFDLSQYSGMTSGDGSPDVRVIFCTNDFGNRIAFSSDGLSCQEFPFDPEGTLISEDLHVMVRDRSDSSFPRWNEYSYIDDLARAGAYDRVFTYDEKRRVIAFGDNENGEVPPIGNDNILIISCSLTSGAHGNISAGNLSEIRTESGSFAVTQPMAAGGGCDRESYEASLRRFRYELSDCRRAVSAEDCRRLALRTPGLRIADVRAIPFFDPDDQYAPKEKLRDVMTLAVLPYSRSRFPVPDEGFLAAVRNHMEKSRLLTVELKTCAPLYVMINISAEIICGSSEVGQVRKNAEQLLRGMFSIYSGDGRSRFGEPVREADLIAGLCSVEGVLAVKYLNMTTDRPECRRTSAGIEIPPHAIACCGAVELITAER